MQVSGNAWLIAQEFKACIGHLREGILAQPSVSSISQWIITLMPQSGIFQDQILTCRISFENFPASVPRIVFQQGTLHPMICPDGHFDCSEMFTDWSIDNHVYTLLNFVFDSFVNITIPNRVSVPNTEAALLLRKSKDAFRKKALKMLPDPPSPLELSEQNAPKMWTPQKERVAKILARQTAKS